MLGTLSEYVPSGHEVNVAMRYALCGNRTYRTLARGCRYPAVTNGLFLGGSLDLIYHAMRRANEHMSDKLAAASATAEWQQQSVNKRLAVGMQARLQYLEPYLSTWPQVSPWR